MNPAAPVKIPVSAVLITRDAARHLERVLAPLSCCAEILILDSGSRDRTREIAAAHGARWHEHPFEGYGPAKRRAVALAAFDWVLSIDADEVLDERSAAALGRRLGRRTPAPAGAAPPAFIGSRGSGTVTGPDWVVRVFNRRHHEVSADPV
jgi:glycosyltransferase involved in cell wall biosynthesis